MSYLRNALAGGLMCIASAALAQEDEVPAFDPAVAEILGGAAEYLASQNDLSVRWFVSYDTVVEGREVLTSTRSGYNLLSRDTGFYAYTEQGMDTREFYYDGGRFTVVDVESDAYAQANFSGGFELLVERARSEYGLELPIWSVLSTGYQGEYMGKADSAAYVGLTRVGGEEAHHLALSSYEEDWQVWISTDPDSPRLLMLVGTDPYSQGWPQFRAYFTDWDFAPEIAEGSFTFVPSETSERMVWPKVPAN